MPHQLGTAGAPYADKRRSAKNDSENRSVIGGTVFTANAGGSTTTIVGANATPATGTNIMRLDDEFKLFTSANALKEETVFRVTAIAVAASTTVTFTPAAAVATVSGDQVKLVGSLAGASSGEKDRRLTALGFSAKYISQMTENDKDYQLRTSDDPGSLP
jgi:hypothetical protein